MLIAGGGTGGHLYPGIAVARELLARVPDAQVTFVGTAAGHRGARRAARRIHAGRDSQRRAEGQVAAVARCAGLRCCRRVPSTPGSVLIAAAAVGGDRRRRVQLGTGRRARGVARHSDAADGAERDARARPIGCWRRWSSAAAVTYEESLAFFGRQGVRLGQSGSAGVLSEEAYEQHSSPPGAARVLVFGGSQGAHAINMAMVEAAPRLAAAAPRVAITHQTGERDLEMVRDGYRRAGLEARVEPFLFAMDREMKSADLVVCRAGATTLAELTAAATAIDSRSVSDGHRRPPAQERARRWCKQGAATMVEQRELTGERLAARDSVARVGRRSRAAADGRGRRAVWRGRTRRSVIVDKVLELAR